MIALNRLPLMERCVVCTRCKHVMWRNASWPREKPRACSLCSGAVFDDFRNINPTGTFANETASHHHQ